jgi:WD40 repeat protein
VWSSEQSLRSVVVDPLTTWAAVQWVGGPLDVIDLDQGRRVRGAQARGEAGFDLRDGTLVFGDLTGEGGRVRVLDDTGDRVVATLPSGVKVTDIEISPDGQQVAVADSSGLVQLLAMGSWKQAGSLAGTTASPIQQIAWADSTRSLHAFDEAGMYLSWDLDSDPDEPGPAPPTARRAVSARSVLAGTEEPVATNLAVVDMEFIPGEGYISVISEREGLFWVDTAPLEFFELIGFRGGRGRALGGAVTRDGGHVFVTGSSMQVLRPDSQGLPFRGVDVDWNAVDVDVRADGTAVTVGSDGSVTMWRVPGEADFAGTSRTPPLDGSAGVVVAPDGRLLLRWDDVEAQLLDATTFDATATLDLPTPGAVVLGAAFVPDSDRLVTHVCSETPEPTWEPCDSVLTSYASDGTIVTGPVDAGPARPSQGATIVAATDVVATVDAAATVTLRDPRTLEPTERLRAPDAPDEPDSSSLSLSPNGRMLTVSTLRPRSLAAWRLGGEADLLVADTAGPAGLAFSDYPIAYGALSLTDDAVLVAEYDAFRTYGADGGEPTAVYPDPFEQGDILASDVLQQAAQSRGTDGITASRSATSDSSLLLTGLPGSYWLWDPSRPLVLAGPMGVDGAVLDPTGDRLFLWRDDGSAFALSLRPDDLVAAACESAGRALTQQEWSRSIGAGEPYEPACPG